MFFIIFIELTYLNISIQTYYIILFVLFPLCVSKTILVISTYAQGEIMHVFYPIPFSHLTSTPSLLLTSQVPQLTEERRKDLAKQAKVISEVRLSVCLIWYTDHGIFQRIP